MKFFSDQLVGTLSQVEVFRGQPTRVVRYQGKKHPVVTNVDVWMVPGDLGLGTNAIDKGQSSYKVGENISTF